ncbi:E3 ubiquitin- ligase ORTHRUS 2-like [Olea europaea subsp. europaea]|uniref:RING-type E3 ubiquitin transferase n=1 Tax=Olea europaea subsp. europaea TaxID=158383 RepID=A0A8S0V336_OLEEU|nr:E3 ubiquitin- ligase ORTHRUS 2-like [Olea europaea subsp. europaea]
MDQVSAQQQQQLPLDADGICMVCHEKPPDEVTLTCGTCATPWHVTCLLMVPENMASAANFECPDCSGAGIISGAPAVAAAGGKGALVTRIREIEADDSLSEKDKARKRQELLSGKEDESESKGKEKVSEDSMSDVLAVLGESCKCSFCMQLPERPVTTPCGHNFCLKCFEKWIKQGKNTCAKCRSSIPRKMAIQPRINSILVFGIRMAKMSKSLSSRGPQNVYRSLHIQDRPDKAFTTERAQKAGMANAASGRIFVTVPKDHFGPITAENDPERNQGVVVGEGWAMRMDCRQWGVHYPPVAGIGGKASYGAQSVVISGGYEDDEDHGEWFIYTGSGGRDLSGNRRTNKAQSFDQEFKEGNQALRVSCYKGYPVRVVRSEKDKRSSYAPEKGYRYDGVYRVEKCWRKAGKQGFKVCRYLFVRCDNEPAPWTSDEHGDSPRSLPDIPELNKALDISERVESPSWDYDEQEACWKWQKPPPASEEKVVNVNPEEREKAKKVIRKAHNVSLKEKLLKGFCCLICEKVLNLPLTTPCAHNFCKPCLEDAFAGKTFTKERMCQNGRKLRSRKNVMKCPACPTDISDYLQNPQVNRELMEVIEKLQSGLKEDENNSGDSSDGKADASNENFDALPGSSGVDLFNAENNSSDSTDGKVNASNEDCDALLEGSGVELPNAEAEGIDKTGRKRKSSSADLSAEHEISEISKKVNVSTVNGMSNVDNNAPENNDSLEKPNEGNVMHPSTEILEVNGNTSNSPSSPLNLPSDNDLQ